MQLPRQFGGKLRTKLMLVVGMWWVISCTSTQKSAVNEGAERGCGPGASDYPVFAILSSHYLGGSQGGPHRVPYSGGVPALAVLYSSNHLIFAKNISKGNSPFFSYFCVKLGESERKNLLEGVVESMPELFDAYDAKDPSKTPGLTEVLIFKGEFECAQYELKGSIAAARELGMRSRSSVAPRVPEQILETIERFSTFDHAQATAWFPDQVLIELRQISDGEAKMIKGPVNPWPESFKLTRVKDKEMRILTDSKIKLFTTNVGTSKLKEFSALMRSKIQREQKVWVAGYRFLLPFDRLWAGPHPTKGEEYSVCNRFIPRTNFWRFYGLNYLVGG